MSKIVGKSTSEVRNLVRISYWDVENVFNYKRVISKFRCAKFLCPFLEGFTGTASPQPRRVPRLKFEHRTFEYDEYSLFLVKKNEKIKKRKTPQYLCSISNQIKKQEEN
uniref:Uncharacterized protein n=1 Tax=Cacopsylla melanoneura TaxID=428564 RepID=A0A8D9F7Z8_9HEMI